MNRPTTCDYKFKQGDLVKILDGRGISEYTGGWSVPMIGFVGVVAKVEGSATMLGGRNAYALSTLEPSKKLLPYVFDERGLERVDPSPHYAQLAKRKIADIKDVIFKRPHDGKPGATIVLYNDGTKSVVKCSPNDVWDPTIGLAFALIKHEYGNCGLYNEVFRKYVDRECRRERLDAMLDDVCSGYCEGCPLEHCSVCNIDINKWSDQMMDECETILNRPIAADQAAGACEHYGVAAQKLSESCSAFVDAACAHVETVREMFASLKESNNALHRS